MNLGELMTRVQNETRHFPDLVDHREDLRAVINAAYEGFCNEAPWPWMTRRAPIYQLPDITFEAGTLSLLAGWGARTVLLPSLFDLGVVPENLQDGIIDRMMVGGEFGLLDQTAEASGTSERGPFTVEAVVEVAAAGSSIQLDPRCTLSGALNDAYVLRFPRILLPPDVKSVLSLADENGRPLRGLMPTEARRMIGVDTRNQAGNAGWFLEDHGFDVRFPPMVDMFLTDPSRSPYAYQRETWPMLETLSLVDSVLVAVPGPDEIPGDLRIRIFACWLWGGRFGPPSEVAEMTTTTGNTHEIEVQGYPTLPTSGAQIEYGRRVAIFMAEGEGAFYLRAIVTNPGIVTTTIAGRNFAGNAQPGLRYARHDEITPPGSVYTYIRVHPRPSALQRYELDYLAHPRKLVQDTDSPEFRDNHEVIVWLAVAQMLSGPRYNGDPRPALMMAERFRQAIKVHNFPQDRYPIRRGQVDQARGPFDFFVPPNIDYIP